MHCEDPKLKFSPSFIFTSKPYFFDRRWQIEVFIYNDEDEM